MHRLLPIALLIACSDDKIHAIDDGSSGADAPGDPTWGSGSSQDVPLAVQIDDGGRVIYTTFHNEQQITVDMEALLMEIILKL